jgi:hypothetical protein
MKTLEPIVTDEHLLDAITDEITSVIIEFNMNILYMIKIEEYEAAAKIRDMITLFILDAASIISTQSGIRKQKAYMHLIGQNDLVINNIFNKYLSK